VELVPKVIRDLLDPQDQWVEQEPKVIRDLLDAMVWMALSDHRDHRDHRDRSGHD
jgi:hypothetical protein